MDAVRSIILGVAASLLLSACGGGGSDAASGPTESCVLASSVPPAPSTLLPPTFTAANLTSATSTRFAGSGVCASCHRADVGTNTNFDSVTGEQVDLTADWAGSMMANSARDPYYLAVLSAEIAANPGHAGAIQGKCLTCHAPMAAYEAKAAGGSLTLADLQTSDLGKDGVSCVLCHRIEEANLGPSGLSYTGNFIVGDETGSARKIYGPYADANINPTPMINQVDFTPAYGPHVRDSKVCGTCHNLITEAIDPENPTVPTGILFPEQMPYKEWLASSYNSATNPKSCQSCHMPETAGGVRLSSVGPNRTQAPFGKHHFAGGNTFMLTMLKQNRAATGVVADDSAFDAAIVRTRNNLTQNTARLDAAPCREDNTLTLPVTITNLTGHKFPTGYPNRRAWLHVRVVDGAGKVVFESGSPGVDGEIVGLANGTMPHYDTISEPGQVQIYEPVMGDVRGNPTRRLMHAARYLKDNRILPAGMSPAVTDPDMKVVGIGSDANFIGGSDRVTYVVNTNGFTGPFNVSVELLYQSVPPRDVAALDPYSTSQISAFKGMYAAADKAPERVVTVALSVP